LVKVYLNKRDKKHLDKQEAEVVDDVILLIQAPEGSQLTIPKKQYEDHLQSLHRSSSKHSPDPASQEEPAYTLDVKAPRFFQCEGQPLTKDQQIFVEPIQLQDGQYNGFYNDYFESESDHEIKMQEVKKSSEKAGFKLQENSKVT